MMQNKTKEILELMKQYDSAQICERAELGKQLDDIVSDLTEKEIRKIIHCYISNGH